VQSSLKLNAPASFNGPLVATAGTTLNRWHQLPKGAHRKSGAAALPVHEFCALGFWSSGRKGVFTNKIAVSHLCAALFFCYVTLSQADQQTCSQ
jgi:hypothetical protein